MPIKIGKDTVVVANPTDDIVAGDSCTIVSLADINNNCVINNQSIAIGKDAKAGHGSIAIGVGANAGSKASIPTEVNLFKFGITNKLF